MSKFVSENCLKPLAVSFILSKLDYCNALFKNIPGYQIEKLQKLQNFAAKVSAVQKGFFSKGNGDPYRKSDKIKTIEE